MNFERLICLFERQNAREGKNKREKQHSIFRLTLQMSTAEEEYRASLYQQPAMTLGFPLGWQKSMYLGHFLILFFSVH